MRIGGMVHARMTSERLPGKQLVPIAGRPALLHLLDRMFACRFLEPQHVVLATPEASENDALAEVAESVGAQVFRGSETDVVDRWHGAWSEHGFDAVVQIDGDDPCVDPLYMDLCMETLLADDETDVVICSGLPLGIASKAIRGDAIERVWQSYVPGDNSTGGSLYFTRSELCRTVTIHPVSEDHVHPRARITLDYPADVTFFEQVFSELYQSGEVFTVSDIVALLRRRPELVEINAWLSDGYWERSDDHIAAEHLRYRMPDGEVREILI